MMIHYWSFQIDGVLNVSVGAHSYEEAERRIKTWRPNKLVPLGRANIPSFDAEERPHLTPSVRVNASRPTTPTSVYADAINAMIEEFDNV